MDRWRLRCVLVATLTLLFGLHVFRVFLPTLIWYLGQFLSAEGLALYALAVLAPTLLAPLLRRRLGEGGTLALTVGGLALVRLGIQWARAPWADLILATGGVVLFGWFIPLWCQSPRNCPTSHDRPTLALAFPLALLLDTGSRTLLLSYDLAWRESLVGAGLPVLVLVGLTLLLLWRELGAVTVDGPALEPSLSCVLPLVGLGPWLYLSLALTHNPAALAAAGGWREVPSNLAVNGLTALGGTLCVIVAERELLQRRAWALSGGGVLVAALALLTAGAGPGGLWMGLAALSLWVALGQVLTGTARVAPLRPGLWRSALVTFLALVSMLVIVTLVTEYDLHWTTPVGGGVVALAAVWATRVEVDRAGPRPGAGVVLVGGVAGIVLLAVGAWAFLDPPPRTEALPPAGQSLRVMTYNIHHGLNADRRMDLRAIADLIAAENPDVVLLNEVNRARAGNGFVDTLPLIGRRLEMPYVFGANYRDGQYGNALLSRYPILTWDNTHYRHNSTEVRGLLRVVVQVADGPLSFFGTHLDHLSGPGNVRAEQVTAALTIWEGQSRAVLLGDLNAEPTAPELQAIYRAGFVDVLAATGQDDAFTFWDPLPSRRIDYVFLTPDLALARAGVAVSRASDHLPVWAEIVP